MTSQEQPEQLVMGNASFEIAASDLRGLEKEALQGSADAAFRLYQYFQLFVGDYTEAMYWVAIAAENGHPVGQHNFGFMLNDDNIALYRGRAPDDRARDKERARYWLRRAAANGDELAVELLREIGD